MRSEERCNRVACACGVEVVFHGIVPRKHSCFRCGAALDVTGLRSTEPTMPVVQATPSGMRRTKKSTDVYVKLLQEAAK